MFRSTVVTLVLSLVTVTAQAGEIRIVASGELYSTGGSLTPSLPIGTPWSLDWRISRESMDVDSTAQVGKYYGLSGTYTLGENTYTSGHRITDAVSVFDIGDFDSGDVDRITAVVTPPIGDAPSIDDVVVQFSALQLWGFDSSLFNGDSLTNIVGLGPSNFQPFTSFRVQVKPPVFASFALTGDVRTLTITNIPIPPAFWLFGSALGVMGWLRRKP